MTLEKTLQVNNLFDLYGALLTPKQQDVIRYYFHDDLSYQEIARILQISRAGVYDIIKRSVDLLEETERKLGLMKRLHTMVLALNQLENSDVDRIVNEFYRGGNDES